MPRTLKALEGVRDDRGRLGRLLLVGGSELLVFFFFKQKTAYEMLRSLVGSEMCIRDRLCRREEVLASEATFK